jgi:crossover junction endodeoxyribonuclease RuvC
MVQRLLRLDAIPQPADAADALALAICHLWRGDTTARVNAALARVPASKIPRSTGAVRRAQIGG